MSSENAEIVRRIFDRWVEGDFDEREPFADDLEFRIAGWMGLLPHPIEARGVDGMAETWRGVLHDWDHFRTGPIEELIEVGDQIVVFCRVGGRARLSGIEVDSQRGAVFTFRAGKVARLFLTDREGALEAAGLSRDFQAGPGSAMSSENAAIVRRIYDRWSQGDYSDREPFAEDVDFQMEGWTLFQPGRIEARGIDGMANIWREVLSAWDDFHTGPIEELIEAGDQVVVFSRLRGRGKITGAEVEAQRGAVFTLHAGKVRRLYLTDREGALAAAGLSRD